MKHYTTKHKQLTHLLYGCIGVLLCVTIVSTYSSSTSAVTSEAKSSNASVTVSSACSMDSSVDTAHTATLPNGIFSGSSGYYPNGIGKTTITTVCNDNSGYAIYAVGYTGNTTTGGNNNKLHSTTLGTSDYDISTGTSKSGNTSYWMMKVTKVTDATQSYNPNNLTIIGTYGSSDYHTVPASYDKVATYSTSTDVALGSKIETTYAAYISPTQPASTYTGKVKYVLVHPNSNDPNSYIVNFISNGGTGTMTAQSIPVGTATALNSNTFTAPTGYLFKEWNTKADGTGTSYANGASVTDLGDAGGTVTLFAIWEKPKTIADLTYMQEFATLSSNDKTSVLNSMTENTEYILKDSRDEKKYYIAKLPDGNVWMTQNLDHDINSSYNYNSTNTDVPANWSDTLTSTYATGTTTWNDSKTTPESYDPGDRCWNGALDPNYSTNLDTGTTACSSITTTPDHYHIGNYYNWTASVAMQNSSSYTADNTDVNQSICPAGWMLPKKTGSGSFYDLVNGRYTAGTSGNIQSSPVYFVYGGHWTGSSSYVSSYGFYWSSVVRASDLSYYLYFSVDGRLYPRYGDNRGFGLLVRCLAR